MMDAHLNELRLDLEELKKFESLAQRESTRGRLAIWKSQIEGEIAKLELKPQESVSAAVSVAQKSRTFTKKITTYAWDQSEKFVKIYVPNLDGVQDIPRESISLENDNHHYTLNVAELHGSNHQLVLPKLLHEVKDPTFKVKTNEIVILLKKASTKHWDTLSEKEKKEKDEKYKPPKMEKDDDPSKGIMDMMKKMYDEGDDEMKRTIAKAWTESRDKQARGEPEM